MSLQIIKSIDGKAEYVLLPVNIYHTLRHEIDEALKKKYDPNNCLRSLYDKCSEK